MTVLVLWTADFITAGSVWNQDEKIVKISEAETYLRSKVSKPFVRFLLIAATFKTDEWLNNSYVPILDKIERRDEPVKHPQVLGSGCMVLQSSSFRQHFWSMSWTSVWILACHRGTTQSFVWDIGHCCITVNYRLQRCRILHHSLPVQIPRFYSREIRISRLFG